MKKKVSDYIADVLAASGVHEVFMVPGGQAMHMNDSFGHHSGLHCMVHLHEQAAAMAAEGYARVNGSMACVCTTNGPGATNAITGVLCAWMDSLPMIVLSGQARVDILARSVDPDLRFVGIQEYEIIRSVEPMTKYAVLVTDPQEIRYHLEKAIYLAKSGRQGPCWLDIPLNVQGATVDTETLVAYDPTKDAQAAAELTGRTGIDEQLVDTILEKIKNAERPVLFGGQGIRRAGAYDAWRELVDLLGIPVVTGLSSVDLMPSGHPLFVGRNGSTGDRAGNFAVQTSDLLFSIGSRQGLFQTGFNYEAWAKKAYTILNDIDPAELKKKMLHVDLPVCADAAELIAALTSALKAAGCSRENPWYAQNAGAGKWISKTQDWKQKYPVVTADHYKVAEPGRTNIYAFYDQLGKALPQGAQILVSVGTSRVVGSQCICIKEGQRFYTNSVTASMGYGLPAAIGVCIASGGTQEIVSIMGEGCLQMNLQELQTIVHHRLPIRIIVVNNEGFHSVRMTQNAYFNGNLVATGPDSGDVSFPELAKIAAAYGMDYHKCCSPETLQEDLHAALKGKAPCICEVFVTKTQNTEPKLASRKLENGQMVSAALEDMYPFLEREELEEIWK